MKEILPIAVVASLTFLGVCLIVYTWGWKDGFSTKQKTQPYKPKTITVKGEKIELYEN